MSKLSDTQLIVLAAAAARDDGCAVIPGTMKPAAVTKVGSSFVDRKLMREVKAKLGMPVWYEDELGRGLCLVITAAGRKAVGVEHKANVLEIATPVPVQGSGEAKATKLVSDSGDTATASPARNAKATAANAEAASPSPITFREGSKQALLVKMLSAKNGVTLQTLEDATGWLPHTMRAALTGLRKKGFVLARDRQPGKHSTYRINGAATPAASA